MAITNDNTTQETIEIIPGKYPRIDFLLRLFNGVISNDDIEDEMVVLLTKKEGLSHQQDDYNLITKKGIRYLSAMGIIP